MPRAARERQSHPVVELRKNLVQPVAANPAAYAALKAMHKAEQNAAGVGAADMMAQLKESAAELIAAIANPKPQVQATPSQAVAAPVSAMEVEVKTSK